MKRRPVYLGYKRTSIIADLARGLTVALAPLLYNTVGLQFWQLLRLVFLGAWLDAPRNTVRQALLEMNEKPIPPGGLN